MNDRNLPEEESEELSAQEAAIKATHEAGEENRSVSTENNGKENDKENTATFLGEAQRLGAVVSDDAAKREMSRRSRRTFLIGGATALAGYGGWRWLKGAEAVGEIPYPLRAAHEFNRRLSEGYFSSSHLAPEFPRSAAREPRVNGGEGMSAGFSPETWRLQVVGVANETRFTQYRESIAYQTANDNANADDQSNRQLENPDNKSAPGSPDTTARNESNRDETNGRAAMEMRRPGLLLTLDDIKRLPRVEMTTQLKCIEGWSEIVSWAGVRFQDFAAQFQPQTRNGSQPDVRNRPADLVRFASLSTPDGAYYVGMDMASALHPQTLLCYEMNEQPLTLEHGAPLRLVTPTKYGIKNIKRIGLIEFTDTRPADYWAERGYDWYSGH